MNIRYIYTLVIYAAAVFYFGCKKDIFTKPDVIPDTEKKVRVKLTNLPDQLIEKYVWIVIRQDDKVFVTEKYDIVENSKVKIKPPDKGKYDLTLLINDTWNPTEEFKKGYFSEISDIAYREVDFKTYTWRYGDYEKGTMGSLSRFVKIDITSPTEGQLVTQGDIVNINVDVEEDTDEPNNLKLLKYFINNEKIFEADNFPYGFVLNTQSYNLGIHKVIINAEDSESNILVSEEVSFQIKENIIPAPVVKITSPQNMSNVNRNTSFDVTVSASDSNGTIRILELFVNDIKYASVFDPATLPHVFNIKITNTGIHEIKAVATDNEDNTRYDIINVNVIP